MSEDKGNVFDGFIGGSNYDRMARIFGFGPSFYHKAASEIPLRPGMCVLDLGCGTASLGLAVAERIGAGGRVHGVDLAEGQLSHAGRKAGRSEVPFEFHCCSMDELPFESETLDTVVTCMALHEATPGVRRGAISEASRVLRPGGIFSLVDWSKPRFGLMGLLWLPFLLLDNSKDNWSNTYPDICRERDLLPEKDVYVNSLVRCQVFRKSGVG